MYCVGVAVTSLLTLVTPPIANASYYALLAIRIIEGLFEVSTYYLKLRDQNFQMYVGCSKTKVNFYFSRKIFIYSSISILFPSK